jgi:hypothetical protein
MSRNIDHVYHQGWDCVCLARQVSLDFFRAAVRCKSLIDGTIENLPESLIDFSSEVQAIELAIQTALGWTRENEHPVRINDI